MKEIEYWIWLTSLEGVSPVKKKNLLDLYKRPEVIYSLSEAELKRTGVLTAKNIGELLDAEKRKRVDNIHRLLIKHNIKLINLYDKLYPQTLKEIYDPPVALYYKGTLNIRDLAVAIVGSRKISVHGAGATRRLAFDLAMKGAQIVSGMARGIDSIAHAGCLDAGGNTVAVLGCGLDTIYPPENMELFEDILRSGGAVISEYPPGMPPLQHNFPARNRIISGLSRGVLVVEAAKKSGSLITASCALEQGREVFAVPGNIDCIYSRGTNQLIRDGAKLVLCAQDVLEEFNYDCGIEEPKTEHSIFRGLSTGEIKIVKLILRGFRQIDEIIHNGSISAQEAGSLLFMLEMKGVVAQYPGKFFELIQN